MMPKDNITSLAMTINPRALVEMSQIDLIIFGRIMGVLRMKVIVKPFVTPRPNRESPPIGINIVNIAHNP